MPKIALVFYVCSGVLGFAMGRLFPSEGSIKKGIEDKLEARFMAGKSEGMKAALEECKPRNTDKDKFIQ